MWKCVFKASWKQETIFSPESHTRKKVCLDWIFDKSPIHLNPRVFTGCTVHHLIPAVQSHNQGQMVIYSYWWVLNSSAFTETGRKAMQWWTKTGAGEGGDAEHFWTNFPRMPYSTGWPAKGKGWGCISGGAFSGLVQPFSSFGGLTRVNVHSFLTVLTLHGTAPFELALTLGDLLDSGGVVAPPAAHDLAAVSATWWLIADPTSCAQGPCRESPKELAIMAKSSIETKSSFLFFTSLRNL